MTTMPDRPAAAVRTCAVLACETASTDPADVINVAPAETLPYPVPLCPEHRQQIARARPGSPRSAPASAGAAGRRRRHWAGELVERGIALADGDGVRWRRGGFSPRLDPRRNFGVLAVEGRVFGSDERVQLDLVLTPAVVAEAAGPRAALPEAEDPR